MLHHVSKQVYKLELPKRWRIYDVFYLSLLEKDTTRKKRVDKKVIELEFEAGDSKEYKVEANWDSAVYTNKAEGHLLGYIIW